MTSDIKCYFLKYAPKTRKISAIWVRKFFLIQRKKDYFSYPIRRYFSCLQHKLTLFWCLFQKTTLNVLSHFKRTLSYGMSFCFSS